MDEQHDRLRAARIRAGFASARSAALRFGWNVSTYAAHENGQNRFGREDAANYSRAFSTNFAWLFLGGDDPNPVALVECIPLVGTVRSEGTVIFQQDWDKHYFVAESKVRFPENSIALACVGTGMWPRYVDQELIVISEYYGDLSLQIDEDEEVVLKLEDGQVLIRNATATPGGLFDLRAHNAALMKGVRAVRAWGIWMSLPRRRWSHSDTSQPLRSREHITEIRANVRQMKLVDEKPIMGDPGQTVRRTRPGST